MARPGIVKLPDESAVTMAVPAPLRETVAPLPNDAGVIVPEIEKVCCVSLKFMPVTSPDETVTFCEAGVNVNPDLVGVAV